jgi:hypothetical protein
MNLQFSRKNLNTDSLSGNYLTGRHHLEDPGLDGRILLKMILGKQGWRNWIHLAQDRDRWSAFVNRVKKLQVLSAKCGEFD